MDHFEHGQPLSMARYSGEPSIHFRPQRFSMSPWPMKQSLVSLPDRLQYSIQAVVLRCVLFERFSLFRLTAASRAIVEAN